ncbi:MAG: SET domain-containing protein-lysine N-methyltransferase [Gemmatimonadota bacterium]|nr:SET domain-containing protein-lysine N-methyltransferase [Gemmatimonadota bacterium]
MLTSARICLLTDQELDLDPLPDDDWPCDPRPFLPDADWTLLTLEKESCVTEIVRAAHQGYDLFFNLCDGAWDEGRVGIEVVQTLEQLEVPFTGADSQFFEPSREAMKRVCYAWGLDTPAYAFVYDHDEVSRVASRLRFPLFVKHPSSYASSGLTRQSRVVDEGALAEQAGIMIDRFGGALVEEFVEGIECTSLVVENAEDSTRPFVYRPLEYSFPAGESFKHYDLKWVDYDGLTSFPVRDPELAARIEDASSKFFQGMNGAGYGRCDIRVDASGRVFMLEINPNAGLYYPPTDYGSADLILAADPEGHAGFTRRIVEAAFARHARRSVAWEVLPRSGGDHGTFARRDLSVGETIMSWEGRPHHLVTLGHVERSWDARNKEWFDRYAWPLTDDVWVTWSPDPDEWRPINHSCEPNAWLEGLDVVARRPIRRGDEITLDYATYYDERSPTFECSCGEPGCRRVIRGDDYLLDVVARYEGHVSDHIQRKRALRLDPKPRVSNTPRGTSA